MDLSPAPLELGTAWGAAEPPRRVLLFSGHMVDVPGRAVPRFPARLESAAAGSIAQALRELGADGSDLALTQGACGGDILFSEACLARTVRLVWLQPFEEPAFLERSVTIGGEHWLARYQVLREELELPPLAASRELGPLAAGVDPYERCNLWLLATALAFGGEKVRCICLWDGGGGDGPGGTAHMVSQVKARGGEVIWLDIRKLSQGVSGSVE